MDIEIRILPLGRYRFLTVDRIFGTEYKTAVLGWIALLLL